LEFIIYARNTLNVSDNGINRIPILAIADKPAQGDRTLVSRNVQSVRISGEPSIIAQLLANSRSKCIVGAGDLSDGRIA